MYRDQKIFECKYLQGVSFFFLILKVIEIFLNSYFGQEGILIKRKGSRSFEIFV